MKTDPSMIAFGPVPSRRLGYSLGINNIPPKHCTYDCVYCQVGPTTTKSAERREFYTPEAILAAVKRRVEEVKDAGGTIDYLTFVPDGEPTLDIHLGTEIELLRSLDIPIAVISNATLITGKEVREELALADTVSLKADSADQHTWEKINRPYAGLDLREIMDGAVQFAASFRGELITETMLVDGINSDKDSAEATAAYLEVLDPAVAYIAVPTRPPSEAWARPPELSVINQVFQVFSARLRAVELLLGYPEAEFTAAGDIVSDILNVTAVHPMRETEALLLLARQGMGAEVLKGLVEKGELVRVMHGDLAFYIRKLLFRES
jgi:wyosine [tRNA(Phe)-imidazoG37] synthetase (radical SAM superfamily)